MHNIETLLAQSGCGEDAGTGAIVAPIHLSTTFIRHEDGSYPHGFSYSRKSNPTRALFENTLAQLEGGTGCLAFSSGMAAATNILQALQPGAHVILPDDVYHGVRVIANTVFKDWGVDFEPLDLTNLDAVKQSIRKETALIWIETPSNPLLKITDIQALSQIAKESNIKVVVDGAWTTPLLQQPLVLGADLVLHSVTKYLAGHSDVLGGAIVGDVDDPLFQRIKSIQEVGGAVMDPFSAWLALRGMRSLAARLKSQCESALVIAQFLADHPNVSRVHFPGLPDHKGHAIAKVQMSAFGAMISFETKGTEAFARRVANNTKVFKQATSLGGTESLIEHRASIEPQPTQTPRTLLRLSVGLEHTDDLLLDLQKALDKSVDL